MSDAPQPQKPPRRPRGSAQVWTPQQIKNLTTFTVQDVANARRWWMKHCPPRFRKLLGAQTKGGDANTEQSINA